VTATACVAAFRRWPDAGVLVFLFLALLVAAGERPLRAEAAGHGTLRIYLARHGQTNWNAAHRLQGSIDTHLDSTGRAQAAALARRLAGVRLDAVYSSRLSRSRETAAIVHGRLAIDSLAELNERRLGKFQGFVQGSDSARSAEFDRRKNAPDDDLDGGETLDQLEVRVTTALDRIRRRHPTGDVLIVGHGLTNTVILKVLLGLSWEQALPIGQSNDELYLIELDPRQAPRLWKWIGTERLTEL
jgi:broad specificity phosphatase PhoE